MKKLVLGLTVLFVGSMFITSCSSDSKVLSQFSKRKYMKNFKKSKLKQKDAIDEYQYANATIESEEKIAKFDNIVLEEVIATDDAVMVVAATNEKLVEVETIKNAKAITDYSSWNTYNRTSDMAEAINYHNNKESKKSKLTNSSAKVNDVVLIILGIFIPPLAVYLYEDSITGNFWVDLILTLFIWIPGIIFAFLVMFAGVSV